MRTSLIHQESPPGLVLSAFIGVYTLATVQGVTSLGSMALGLSIIYRTGLGAALF